MKSRSYQADLHKALKCPLEAAEYMKAALEEGDPEVFLLALRDVAATILSEGKDLQEPQHELAEARKEIEEAKALIAKHFPAPTGILTT